MDSVKEIGVEDDDLYGFLGIASGATNNEVRQLIICIQPCTVLAQLGQVEYPLHFRHYCCVMLMS